jgi:hypothetical protein
MSYAIVLTSGSYNITGFQLALNYHYVMQLVFGPVTYHYVFRQVGF